jgi:hypothetical protein
MAHRFEAARFDGRGIDLKGHHHSGFVAQPY